MNADYFLVHRAHQLQNLCSRSEGSRIQLPGRHSRGGLPRDLVKLLKSLDRICQLRLGDDQRPEFLGWLRDGFRWVGKGRGEQKSLLAPSDRRLLSEFERSIVRLRFSDDERSANFAAGVIQALLDDRAFFYGLKPLPQHTDAFPYETLFPTWLNLYTAMTTPSSRQPESCFTLEQQQALFGYLDDWLTQQRPHEHEIVGVMTFIANRFDPPQSRMLLQRLMNQAADQDCACLRYVCLIFQESTQSKQFKLRIRDLLTVGSCTTAASVQDEFDVVSADLPCHELPKSAVGRLSEIDERPDDTESRYRLYGLLHAVLAGADGFDASFASLLDNYPQQFIELLELVAVDAVGGDALERSAQGLVAESCRREIRPDGAVDVGRVQAFAQNVASRLGAGTRSMRSFLCKEFICKPANRRALLAASSGDEPRTKMARQLLKMAAKAAPVPTFFYLMSMAAAFDPTIDNDSVQQRISVLESVRRENSIGKQELEDLVNDMRANLPESLRYLENPIRAATGKPDRLAKLYLTVNEECELYRHHGRVSNFGVTRAQFSHLSRLIESDE